jgi:hypothetical protein
MTQEKICLKFEMHVAPSKPRSFEFLKVAHITNQIAIIHYLKYI